jgi:hypothetical protein
MGLRRCLLAVVFLWVRLSPLGSWAQQRRQLKTIGFMTDFDQEEALGIAECAGADVCAVGGPTGRDGSGGETIYLSVCEAAQ